MKSFKKHLDEKYNTCPSCKGSGVHHVGKDHDGVSKEFECSHCDGRGKTKVGVREDIEQVDESGSEESVKIEETTFKRNPHPPGSERTLHDPRHDWHGKKVTVVKSRSKDWKQGVFSVSPADNSTLESDYVSHKHLRKESVDEAAQKTEKSGAKKGKGAFYGRKKDAKKTSNKLRRAGDERSRTSGETVWLTRVEGKADYDIYHRDFSSAVQHAEKNAQKRGFKVDEDDWANKVAHGPKKPSSGKTNSYSIDLTDKSGKPSRKKLHMQVYNMDNKKYELNMYIESVEQVDETSDAEIANQASQYRAKDKLATKVRNRLKEEMDEFLFDALLEVTMNEVVSGDKLAAQLAKRKAQRLRQKEREKKSKQMAKSKPQPKPDSEKKSHTQGSRSSSKDHIIMQLRRAQDVHNNIDNPKPHMIKVSPTREVEVTIKQIDAILKLHDAMNKPDQKRKFRIDLIRKLRAQKKR